ncbi:MAG: outer membrane protein transport protein [Thermodesulfobacteriota bacterium]|nr:outer membrane protein transport protein [Thermodesulfobacteriota bacterium]
MVNKIVLKMVLLSILIVLLSISNPLFAQSTFDIIPAVKIASSPNPVGSGARAQGMGSAFIGVADDATAASWNPGGLMQLETPECSIVYDYNYQDYHDDGTNNFEKINYLSAAYPFRIFNKNMIVSLNYQRLYDFYMPTLGFSQNYNFIYPDGKRFIFSQDIKYQQSGSLRAFAPAYAIQITPRFSVGATFNIWTDDLAWDNGWNVSQEQKGSGIFRGNPVVTSLNIKEEYEDMEAFNSNIGFLWDITNLITIGGVFKTPYKADFKHTYETRSSQIFPFLSPGYWSFNQLKYKEDFEMEFPMSCGLGMALRFSDNLTVGLDAYWTKWGQFLSSSKNRVKLEQFPPSWPPEPIAQPSGKKVSPIDGRTSDQGRNVHSTIQSHIGMEYLFILEKTIIPLRLGVFYDPEPSHKDPDDFWGVSAGSGLMFYNRIIIDFAYIFRTGKDVKKDVAGFDMDIDQHKFMLSVIYHF